MPRVSRQKFDSGIYHVMLRGINRQTIFEDEEDCEKFIRCLQDCKSVSGFNMYAYCLMGNHVHLLMHEGKEPLQLVFKRIGSRYVYWYNWKYQRTGHLFQDRFKSEPIKDDRQFIAVLRYIYQNPVKANMCKMAEEYAWSSYRLFTKINSIIDIELLEEIVTISQIRASINQISEDKFIDITTDMRLTDKEASEMIKKFCGIEHNNELQGICIERLESSLKYLHREGCSIRQLVRLSGITKAKVERLLS